MTEHTEKRKKRKSYKRLAITELVIILGLVCGLSWDLFIRDRGSSNNEQTVPASKQITTSSGEDPGARTKAVIEKEETFYQLNGKKILYNDGALGQVYLPVFENVPACSLDMNDLVTRNGYSFYRENGNITSIAGIDISEYQHDINWEQVKAAGVDFAMIRVGYRTYGGGEMTLDAKFKENIEQADKALQYHLPRCFRLGAHLRRDCPYRLRYRRYARGLLRFILREGEVCRLHSYDLSEQEHFTDEARSSAPDRLRLLACGVHSRY